jgi:hypothetical protein
MPGKTSDESTLRDFLLGALPAERAEQVAGHLAGDPALVEALRRLAADDPLTQALVGASTAELAPADLVAHTIRSTLHALGVADTPPADATADMPAASPPARLGAYRVVRVIGRGGMGVVVEAADDELRRRVAIKIMAPELATAETARARFVREARAAAAIDHTNVVPIYHVGEENGVPFLVMPLLRGESLETRLRRAAPLPPGWPPPTRGGWCIATSNRLISG